MHHDSITVDFRRAAASTQPLDRMRTLRATQCSLEPQVKAHAREMFQVLSDAAIYEFENEAPPSADWLADRYSLLETRASTDGTEKWLNWVVRVTSGELAGYVQATVLQSGASLIAYELASRYWRRGIGRAALLAMNEELASRYGVSLFVAVLKAANYRSLGLLLNLGFMPGTPQQFIEYEAAPDELVMVKTAGDLQNTV
jgi:[ribosomal protein S5]-alanine N-acetyltransferase